MKAGLGVLFALLLNACTPPPQESTAAAAHIEITPDRMLLWQAGTGTQMRALYRDEQGNAITPQPVFSWSSSNAAVVTVGADGVVTAVADGEATVTASGSGLSASARVVVNTGVLVISGQARYEDQYYSASGVTGTRAYKPVRYALVDVIDANGVLVQTTATDASGNYQIGVSAAGQYSVRVISQSAPALAAAIEVNDLAGNLYAASQALDLLDPASANIDISIASGLAGAFNILDIYAASSELLASYSPATQSPLAVFWESGNESHGTYFCTVLDATYCPAGAGIYVLSQASASGDHDEFDDDVLWHEYSHYVAQTLSRDDSPGGCHVLTSNDLDLRLSWSEGWGDYFPAAMKSWLRADAQRKSILSIPDTTAASVYVDTYGTFAGISLDVGAPGGYPYYYAGSEISIAKVLWELTAQFGFAPVWDVMENHMPSLATPANIEGFWDGWLTRHLPDASALTTLDAIFGERQLFYRPDAFESDAAQDATRLLAPAASETHTLYLAAGGADKDVVAVNVSAGASYTVQTFDLLNGADTSVKIVDGAGSQIAANDDAFPNTYSSYDSMCGVTRVKNNGTALSSAVTFTAPVTGLLYVEVTTTPDLSPYPSAGRYGSYSLRVVQN